MAEAELCWNKVIRCLRLRSRKTSLSVQAQEGSLEATKGGGSHPTISVDMHPQASTVQSILAKSCAHILGRVLDESGVCEERNEMIGER